MPSVLNGRWMFQSQMKRIGRIFGNALFFIWSLLGTFYYNLIFYIGFTLLRDCIRFTLLCLLLTGVVQRPRQTTSTCLGHVPRCKLNNPVAILIVGWMSAACLCTQSQHWESAKFCKCIFYCQAGLNILKWRTLGSFLLSHICTRSFVLTAGCVYMRCLHVMIKGDKKSRIPGYFTLDEESVL